MTSLFRGIIAASRRQPAAPPPESVVFSEHRYWRAEMLEANGTNSYQLAEIELHDTIGGSDLTGSGTASSNNAGNGAAANAVDNSSATVWRSSGVTLPIYWQYDFGAGNDKAICEIVLTAGTTNADTRSPRRWQVSYSDDGSAFTPAWDCKERSSADGAVKTFRRPTISYRVNVSLNNGAGANTAHELAEVEFRAVAGGRRWRWAAMPGPIRTATRPTPSMATRRRYARPICRTCRCFTATTMWTTRPSTSQRWR